MLGTVHGLVGALLHGRRRSGWRASPAAWPRR
jgi:hypothetical protein